MRWREILVSLLTSALGSAAVVMWMRTRSPSATVPESPSTDHHSEFLERLTWRLLEQFAPPPQTQSFEPGLIPNAANLEYAWTEADLIAQQAEAASAAEMQDYLGRHHSEPEPDEAHAG